MTRDTTKFYAHVADDGRLEMVKEHLTAVGEISSQFAGAFGSANAGLLVGVLHDLGKYSDGFQRRILEDGPRVDHSTAGAFMLAGCRNPHPVSWLLAYPIAGHHGGLPDGGSSCDGAEGPSLQARLRRARRSGREWWERSQQEGFAFEFPDLPGFLRQGRLDGFKGAFWARMLFSCLVDADFLCTEKFMQNAARPPLVTSTMSDLKRRFEEKIMQFYPPESRINEIRCHILDECAQAARGERGFYSLTVPTGGGKTLASMRFALHHIIERGGGCGRVVYAIPYTSIIEQNAAVFRKYLGAENVLEYHGGLDFDGPAVPESASSSGDDLLERLRLAAENWDAPVVVTTNVQLFESLYSCKTSKCRKLHNLANSVIILDEAQMLPVENLAPCLEALEELVNDYGCTVVFCTATQPALSVVRERFEHITEMCSNTQELFRELTRVSYEYAGVLDDDALVGRLTSSEQGLCIVNSRKQARALYDAACKRCDHVFHLSTLMYPEHRSRVIAAIRFRLKNKQPCLVVSTSLVEAGVDLDFPIVYRAFAGLDSIVQAAGRCNREGNRPAEESRVVIFDPGSDYKVSSEVAHRAEIARSTLQSLGFFCELSGAEIDVLPASPTSITQFFERLYRMRLGGMDKRHVLERLKGSSPSSIPFKAVSDDFRLIEDSSFSVIIPCEPGVKDLLERVRVGDGSRGAMRKLSRYAVSVWQHDLGVLLESGVVRPLAQGFDVFVLCIPAKYSEGYGLDISAAEGEGLIV